MQMEMCIMEIGKTINLMDTECTSTKMVPNMRVIGKKTYNMEMVKSYLNFLKTLRYLLFITFLLLRHGDLERWSYLQGKVQDWNERWNWFIYVE